MAILAINLKSYAEAAPRTLEICRIAAELGSERARIVVCPQAFYLSEAAKLCETWAEHVDPVEASRETGYLPVEVARLAGARGSLVNHSEHRLDDEQIGRTVEMLRERGMTSLVCARDDTEAARLAGLKPDIVAVEPPELIGGEVSVSSADPGLIERSVSAVKSVSPDTLVLVGAGVRTADDIRTALEIGADGVLLASEVAKAEDPRATIERLLEGF